MKYPTLYRTTQIDGLSIFYREAGPKDAPTILLLHGLPSSSRMFEPLFARLADRYHLIAPDYPGFGHSDWPDPKTFAYTFDHLAGIMTHFTEAIGLSRYTLYMQDYGGPVGFRIAVDAIQQCFGQERKDLDQRISGIAIEPVIRPFRGKGRDSPLRLGQQLAEIAVVEIGNGERHSPIPATATLC